MVTKTASVVIACIYRPPGSINASFYDELSDLFHHFLLLGKKFIVCGDFNCPSKTSSSDPDERLDERLTQLLLRHNLTQHVNQATHEGGNTMDLVISADSDISLVNNIKITVRRLGKDFTDHFLVHCTLAVSPIQPSRTKYAYRNIKKIDIAAFRVDLLQSKLFNVIILTQTVIPSCCTLNCNA
jgi:exonuclease III